MQTFKNLRVLRSRQSDGYVILPSTAEEPVRPLLSISAARSFGPLQQWADPIQNSWSIYPLQPDLSWTHSNPRKWKTDYSWVASHSTPQRTACKRRALRMARCVRSVS
jgi:hypothetical protein